MEILHQLSLGLTWRNKKKTFLSLNMHLHLQVYAKYSKT